MACNCGKSRTRDTRPKVFEVDLPGGGVERHMSAVEAKRAVRKAGGGTIRRKPVDQ